MGDIGTKSNNPERFYGCYKYKDYPMLIIKSNLAYLIPQKYYISLNGFLFIKNNDYIISKNEIIIGDDNLIKITSRNTGFHYEFKRDVYPPTIIFYNQAGKKFELVKSKTTCLSA